MEKNRLEAFSDGVIAIMVLELRPPSGVEFDQLKELLPVFLSYVLSFIYVGIYWNNHHHMFQSTTKVTVVSVRDGVGRRKSSRADAHGGLRLRAADGGARVFYFAAGHHC